MPPSSPRVVVICELCKDWRITLSRAAARTAAADHALDEHRARLFAVARKDRANFLLKMFRYTAPPARRDD